MSKKDITTLTITPRETAETVKASMLAGISLFVWGPPGISKSATAQQVATQAGMAFIDVRLSQMEPTDLRGVPYMVTVGGVQGISWAPPHMLPRNLAFSSLITIEAPEAVEVDLPNPKGSNGIHYVTDVEFETKSFVDGAEAVIVERGLDRVTVALVDANGKYVEGRLRLKAKGDCRGILALEEFNSAAPSIQAASYQLVLDRRLGEYIVPSGVMIMAMGNRDVDRGATFKMVEPVKNRFVHVEMRHDFKEWQEWAVMHDIHKDVVGYLSAFEGDLFDFNPGSGARAFATPRSWEFVSKILHDNEAHASENVLRALIFGAVGDAVGAKFMSHREAAQTIPNPERVLRGEIKRLSDVGLTRLDPSLSYALVTELAYKLHSHVKELKGKHGETEWKTFPETEQLYRRADAAITFMLNNLNAEINIMAGRLICGIYKMPFPPNKVPSMMELAKKYKQFILPGT